MKGMPTPEVLLESLQPLMVDVWATKGDSDLLRWANERMLGRPAEYDLDGQVELSASTGLHRYGNAHLSDPDWDGPHQTAEALTDAVNICVLTRHRAQVGGEVLLPGLEFCLREVERACISCLKLLAVQDERTTCSDHKEEE